MRMVIPLQVSDPMPHRIAKQYVSGIVSQPPCAVLSYFIFEYSINMTPALHQIGSGIMNNYPISNIFEWILLIVKNIDVKYIPQSNASTATPGVAYH